MYFFMRDPTSEMRCRRGYSAVALEMAYASTQMAVELLGAASVVLFVAWWLVEEAVCCDRREWVTLSAAATEAIKETERQRRREGEERMVARV